MKIIGLYLMVYMGVAFVCVLLILLASIPHRIMQEVKRFNGRVKKYFCEIFTFSLVLTLIMFLLTPLPFCREKSLEHKKKFNEIKQEEFIKSKNQIMVLNKTISLTWIGVALCYLYLFWGINIVHCLALRLREKRLSDIQKNRESKKYLDFRSTFYKLKICLDWSNTEKWLYYQNVRQSDENNKKINLIHILIVSFFFPVFLAIVFCIWINSQVPSISLFKLLCLYIPLFIVFWKTIRLLFSSYCYLWKRAKEIITRGRKQRDMNNFRIYFIPWEIFFLLPAIGISALVSDEGCKFFPTWYYLFFWGIVTTAFPYFQNIFIKAICDILEGRKRHD